jgi:hypothetical protein
MHGLRGTEDFRKWLQKKTHKGTQGCIEIATFANLVFLLLTANQVLRFSATPRSSHWRT